MAVYPQSVQMLTIDRVQVGEGLLAEDWHPNH